MWKNLLVKLRSSAPGFRWTFDWDIIGVQTQEPTPMSNTTNSGERGRYSAPRKAATVLRLLRGESLKLLSRELGVTAATLAGWRDDFLAGGQAALNSRPADDRDEEIARLRAKVGELTMDNELLFERHGYRTPCQARSDSCGRSKGLDADRRCRKAG
jgi:transposase-like protein